MAPSSIPHPFVLLVGCVFLGARLTWIVPAGQSDRHEDPATGRSAVVPGSYHPVEASPVGPFKALVAIPRGMTDAGSVIFLVFLVGGAFSVVDGTGAFRQGVFWIVHALRNRTVLVIPITCVAFAIGGAVEGMWEEIVALVPVLLMLTRMLGFDAVTAVAMSLGAAGVGSTFSPLNPFSVGIAQRVAQVPLLSGLGFRMAVLLPALAIWIWGTMRHASRTRTAPVHEAIDSADMLDTRRGAILLMIVGTLAFYVFGVLRFDWGFDEMSALFFVMGIVAGLLGGLGIAGTAEAFVNGFRSMAYAAVLIGVARAIFVVLDDGRIVDTIIHAMVTPLIGLPATAFALGMTVVQTIITIPVPSSSGRAVLTMPILAPASDLLGVSRQVTVLAYQYGAGVLGQIVPTDGALMAILALAGVRFEAWLRFAVPLCGVLFALGLLAVAAAVALGIQ
jgi:uncharacterized ion transporter superfamily protein YfcC